MKHAYNSIGVSASLLAGRIIPCRRGATISEFALGAMVLAAAAGAANSPRVATVRSAPPQVVHSRPVQQETAEPVVAQAQVYPANAQPAPTKGRRTSNVRMPNTFQR
jgi:hypothetical protein